MSNKITCLNDKLIRAEASIYFCSDTINVDNRAVISLDDIVDICLIFDHLELTVSCDQIGQSTILKEGNYLENINMQENGCIRVFDISNHWQLSKYIGAHLEYISQSKDEYNFTNGVKFNFTCGELAIINLGDQLTILD